MEPLNREALERIAIEKVCDVALPLKEEQAIEVVWQFFDRVFQHPECQTGQLLFGGGTSLVCAYDELTQRFSEDVDLRFCPKPKSTRQLRQVFTEIVRSLVGFTLVDAPKEDSHKIEYHLNPLEQSIGRHTALRPHIKLEVFFTDTSAYPPVCRPLLSIYRRTLGLPPKAIVPCVALEQTAIDKLCALLWRIYSNGSEDARYDPADMRHLNDLAYLADHLVIDETFRTTFHAVFEADFASRLKDPREPAAIVQAVRRHLANVPQYATDFKHYVENVSYAKTPLSFKYCLAKFNALLESVAL